MKFNINDYKGKYVMHCKTEEETKDFLKILDSLGLKWCSGDSYLTQINCNHYMKNICYDFNMGQWASLEFYKGNNYTILEWSDFMNREFTKSDLRSGDVVKRRNGDIEIVCLETGTLISPKGYSKLEDIGEDLTNILCGDANFDIIAVRRPTMPKDCQFDAFYYKFGKRVYERAEEMTLEEVCKLLGREIKIVKGK